MIYYSESEIIVRNMHHSDVQVIVGAEIEQGWNASAEKYLDRLRDQEAGKSIALVAEYKGNLAGYINVYPNSLNGAFGGKGYSEIVDFGVFEKYRNNGIGTILMNVAEKIAAEYSDIVYLGVGLHSGYGNAQRLYVKRGYIPDRSGVWYDGKPCPPYLDCKNNDDLVLYFSKKLKKKILHKFSMINTAERPYLKWLRDGVKTAEGRVNTEKYQKIKIGDEIVFTDTKSEDFIRGTVVFKHKYATFEEMLKSEGVKNMLPFLNDTDLEKGIQVYQNFPGAERVKKFGCVVIGIDVTESKLEKYDCKKA